MFSTLSHCEISKHFKFMETRVRNFVNFQSTYESHSNMYYVIVNKLTLEILTVIQRSRFSVSVL